MKRNWLVVCECVCSVSQSTIVGHFGNWSAANWRNEHVDGNNRTKTCHLPISKWDVVDAAVGRLIGFGGRGDAYRLCVERCRDASVARRQLCWTDSHRHSRKGKELIIDWADWTDRCCERWLNDALCVDRVASWLVASRLRVPTTVRFNTTVSTFADHPAIRR